MKKTTTDIATATSLTTTQRVAIGLVAISLSVLSLAFGVALFASPGANSMFVPVVPVGPLPATTASSVTLSWVVPGGDGTVGQPVAYSLRYALSPITSQSFFSATPVSAPATPGPIGSTETVTVTGLQPSTAYFFAFTATDATGHISALSSVMPRTTSALADACVPSYTCSAWSACSAGEQNRTCVPAAGCSGGLDQPVVTQRCSGPDNEPVRLLTRLVAIGTRPGTSPSVQFLNPDSRSITQRVMAFDEHDTHGVFTATGDLTGDHQPEVLVGSGVGSSPAVKMYRDNGSFVTSFNPFPTETTSGVTVAVADITGDGQDELITMPAKSAAQIRVWHYDSSVNAFTQVAQAFAFSRSYQPGFTLAAGDLNNDGRAEIVVVPRTNGNAVVVMSLSDEHNLVPTQQFVPYTTTQGSGLSVTVADIFGTGHNMIIVGPNSKHTLPVKVFDAQGRLQTKFILDAATLAGSPELASLDVNHDGQDELLVSSWQRGQLMVKVYRFSHLQGSFAELQNYFVFPRTVTTGLRFGSL